MGFRGKTPSTEQSIAHWLTSTPRARSFMIPSIAGGGVLRRSTCTWRITSPSWTGWCCRRGRRKPGHLRGDRPSDWSGDRARHHEIDLLEEFAAAGKRCSASPATPVDQRGVAARCPDLALHHRGRRASVRTYDRHFHEDVFTAGSGLARLYPGTDRARVNSIHHQGVKTLGGDLAVEAVSVPDEVIEAIRWQGASYMVGVQWHPEFHDPADPTLLNGEPLLQEFLQAAEQARSR
jgi:putative glutamine amidotransferase